MSQTVNKPVIAVDVDDVLGAENDAVRTFINEHYGHDHTPEDYLVEGEYWGYWESIWGVHPEEARERLEAFLASPAKDKLKLVEGAAAVIDMLKERFNLAIVTSRYGRQLETTRPWLEQHFPGIFSRVEFVAAWSTDKKATKAIICKAIGAGYLIDDNPEHCNLAAEEGIMSLLFGDYGWNRNAKTHPAVVRVKNWQEVAEYFNEP